jgi:hypothetical protein
MEYQVFQLDPRYVREHMGEVLFESDDLHAAISFASDHHDSAKIETCVWQPRTQGYRDLYFSADRELVEVVEPKIKLTNEQIHNLKKWIRSQAYTNSSGTDGKNYLLESELITFLPKAIERIINNEDPHK